ncbi:MAG: ABC transporter ATP-binding protein [Anaerolineae bacterium]|uniref:ABC transporter ATP-binding protein n=1 Tax=Promineifilum sp. TaxID=2664178 RepID=UPI001D6071DC|nr:ABC transporter ATP-binding protein [Anaerolineales bacterium]MCB8934374.1 ABC transporter ATP-binding protein [Promineifilum sp.]MCO5182256.1 ABC transporter ATP-binding protein [Promineifilum sp.]MCW5847336.1 ABC transporter ATP-binding protein [Anaerolineae bacterium]
MTDSFRVELLDVTKRFGDAVAVDALTLQVRDGEFFSLIGPSGCGKTTTLRMIAGFEQPTDGRIFIGGQPVEGIPAHQRPVNTVFQNYALFPHMTVAQNVAFGLEMQKVAAPDIKQRVAEALELVRLPQMAERKPRQLSGGQQQRVALARALVNRPQVLLLDEPLGALDLKLRRAMQIELKHIQSDVGITFIYVTHDQEEAMTMSDRIGIMNEGILQQVGSPHEVYEKPVNRFVADFIGETNFLPATVARLETEEDYPMVALQGGVKVLAANEGHDLQLGRPVTLTIRPERINLYPQGEVDVLKAESGLEAEELARILGAKLPGAVDMKEFLLAEPENVVLDGVLEEAFYIGTDTRFRVMLEGGASLVVRQQNYGSRYDMPFDVGSHVYVQWAAENAQILIE